MEFADFTPFALRAALDLFRCTKSDLREQVHGHASCQSLMRIEKKRRWLHDMRILRYEIDELREFVRVDRIFWWAIERHAALDPQQEGVFGPYLWRMGNAYGTLAIRRLVKPHKDAASLVGLMDDLLRFHSLAVEVFGESVPARDTISNDIAVLSDLAQPIVIYADNILAHSGRDLSKGVGLASHRTISTSVSLLPPLAQRYLQINPRDRRRRLPPISAESVGRIFPWTSDEVIPESYLTFGE